MSKVLKVIADILLILFILAAAAIFVPPLFGVTTAVATPEVTTNMAQGSVAYGKRVPLEELASGDTIIYNGDDYALLCEVESVDLEKDIVTVEVEGTTQQIQFHNSASRQLFVIPFIGYMSIALQTFEGRIILALVAALIVVLFIVSEVWGNKEKYDRDYERDEEEDDDEYFRSLAKNAEARTERPARERRPRREQPDYENRPGSPAENVFAAADAGISGAAAGAAGAAGAAAAAFADDVPDDKTMDLSAVMTQAPAAEEPAVPSAEQEAAAGAETFAPAEESEAAGAETFAPAEASEAEAAAEISAPAADAVSPENTFEDLYTAEETAEAAVPETASVPAADEAAASVSEVSGSGQEGIAAAAAAGAATVAAATAAQADRTPEAAGTADESAAAVQAETVAQAETAADMAADAGSAAAIAAGAAAAVPEEKGTPAGQILQDSGAEDLSDLNDEQMEGMESALETALAKAEEADKTDHSASVPPEAQDASYESLEDAPDEIELAIPVRTLEEVLQEAYSNGDDPHIRKDPTTGITMVDFSESFAGGKTEDWD